MLESADIVALIIAALGLLLAAVRCFSVNGIAAPTVAQLPLS